MRFINFERTKLPEEILKHNLEEKRKYFSDICLEVDKSDAEVQVNVVLFSLYSFFCDCTYIFMGLCLVVLLDTHSCLLDRLRACTTKGFRIWQLLSTR